MYSKAKIGTHPIHPMIVAFPIVFYTLTPITFIVYRYFYPDIFWYKVGYFSNFAGVLTALLAAVPGFIDWAFGIPKNTAAKKRGLIHMALNVVALVLFAISAYCLYGSWNEPVNDLTLIITLTVIGVVLTMAAGYHGWELIATHKVGVLLTPQQQRLEPVDQMDPKAHEVDAHPRQI